MRELTVIAVFFFFFAACEKQKNIPADTDNPIPDIPEMQWDLDTALPDTDEPLVTDDDGMLCEEGETRCEEQWVMICSGGVFEQWDECVDCGPLCQCSEAGGYAACTHVDPGDDMDVQPDDDELLTDNDAEPCGTEFKRRCNEHLNGIDACRNGYWEFDEQCCLYCWCTEDTSGHANCVHQDPGPDDGGNIQPDENTVQPDADELLTDN